MAQGMLEMRVMDEDEGCDDDFIGSAVLHFDNAPVSTMSCRVLSYRVVSFRVLT